VANRLRWHLHELDPARCRDLTAEINAVEAELRPLVRQLAPTLLAVPGCGVLGAAMILGETAGVGRFRSMDAYARFIGTAPIPVWSGDRRGRVRLNRGGNRTINTALHMIAVTQLRGLDPGPAYVERLMARARPAPRPFGCCAGGCRTWCSPLYAPTSRPAPPTPRPAALRPPDRAGS
jgi:transposase